MILGIGIDICEIKRISKVLEKFSTRFENRCFTERERIKCRKSYDMSSCYAKRFAAKEAAAKALGTGFRNGVFWRDLEVTNLPSGKPTITFHGNSQLQLKKIANDKEPDISLTITDEFPYAQAIVTIN